MNILFFLEPSIELGNPLFRYATLRNSLLPQIKSLRGSGHNVVTFLSESVAEKCVEDNRLTDIGEVAVVDPLEWMNGEGYFPRSMRHQRKEYFSGEIAAIQKLIVSSFNDSGFIPDVIVVWESPTYYLEQIFPNAKVVYQMPGVFSRPPYANMVSFDSGLLADSSKIPEYSPSLNELNSLIELREKDEIFLSSVSPTRHIVENIKRDFTKVVLLPLQIDNYFMISSVLGEGKSQFDILVECLRKLPENIALLVTNYISRDTKSAVLSNESVKYLRNKYKNFKYVEETNSIPWVSQYLTREVDGVITISSSLGYQATYWGKPLLAIGKSHISEFSSAGDIEEFIEQVRAAESIFNDNKLLSLLNFKNLPQENLSDENYSDWLINSLPTNFKHKWSENAAEDIIEKRRETAALESLVAYTQKFSPPDDHRCKELSVQIRRYQIVSFDIFDTLLMRPFRHPTDLYDFIEPQARAISGIPHLSFKRERKKAEKIAFEQAIATGLGEITLEEIYTVLADNLGLSADSREKLMQLEMQSEYDLLYPRKSGYRAYLEAKQLGKKIIFVSDMYLSAEFLAKVLDKNGYGEYDKLYVSSEHRVKKHSGALFDYVLNDLDVSPEIILHVGDNVDADVKKAQSRGLKPFHLKKSYDEFTLCTDYRIPWERDENRHSLDWKILLSIAGNNLHDNPYLPFRNNTLFGGSPVKLGYYGMGALLLGYAKWLVENAIKDNVERLYFLSRDGKLMKRAYDVVAKLYDNAPSSHYLLCSRRAVNLAKVKTHDDIIDLANVDYANNVRISHLLLHRFGLDINNISEEKLAKYGFNKQSKLTAQHVDKLQDLLIDIKDDVLAVAEKERDSYLQYLESMGIFSEGNTSIVDIGYAGTMQQSLHQLSPNNKNIGGYYLITFRTALKRVAENGLNIKGYLAEFIDRHDTYHNFCRHVPLYETLFSCSDTTFVRMTKDWRGKLTPVFMAHSPVEDIREHVVEEIQQGAINYVAEVTNILHTKLKDIDIEPNKTLRNLDIYFTKPHPRDARILSGVMFEDAYGGTQYKTILPAIENIKLECVWKQGREALLNDLNQSAGASVAVEKENVKKTSVEIQVEGNVAAPNGRLKKKIIYWIMTKTLNERKKKKFIKNPYLFFADSKNGFIKRIGKGYMS